MTRTRKLIAATVATACLTLAVGAQPAQAAFTARCTSSYWVATASGFDVYAAVTAAAKSVWTKRYGNFGGWIVDSITSTGGGKFQVFGHRPGAFTVVAYCSA